MKKDKVPKWSKAAFQDKFNIMKGKLENVEDEREKKYSDMDANLAKLQRKLRDGSALETGERGKKCRKVENILKGSLDLIPSPSPQANFPALNLIFH